MSHDTGGAAFPYAAVHGCNGEYGMTLRDYFAAKAMATLLELWHKDWSANEELPDFGLAIVGNEYGVPLEIAEEAYAMADAMLKERNK